MAEYICINPSYSCVLLLKLQNCIMNLEIIDHRAEVHGIKDYIFLQ